MWLCDLFRKSRISSTVENLSGKVEAAGFPIFHTPFRGVEKWKEPPARINEGGGC